MITSEAGGGDWRPATHPLVSLREDTDAEGALHPLKHLERPPLLIGDDGAPLCLCAAAAEGDPFQGTPSSNLALPLSAAVESPR